MSVPARPALAATSPMATGYTSRSMPARPGSTSVCATRGTSVPSSLIRETRISCSSPHSGTRSAPTKSAGSSAPAMAARAGSGCCSTTATRVGSMSSSLPATRIRCSLRYGRGAANRGGSPAAAAGGGFTWKLIEHHGLPDGPLGRIGVSVSGADSNRVYAAIEAKEGGVFRSDDGGDSWMRVNSDHRFRQRAWYYSHIFADPVAPNTVYVLDTGAFRSTNGGKDFELLPAPHGDHHALWIDPRDPARLINGNDGGATISVDGGKSWTAQYNQPTAQFYHVAVDNHWPYRIYGVQQDNSTIAIASRADEGVIGRQDWYEVGGGESGYIAPDPRDPEIVYANADSGQMTRYDHRTGNQRDVSIHPLDVSGNGAADLEYRIQWTEPVLVSLHDSKVLYTAAQFVLKSSDQGRSWRRISADLTRNDKSKRPTPVRSTVCGIRDL